MNTSLQNQNQYQNQYQNLQQGVPMLGALRGNSLQYRLLQHKTRGRFLGLVYANLIFMFMLMAAATILSMYSRAFRHFVHNKITVIVLGILLGISSLLVICCEMAIKRFQIVFFVFFSIILALLAGSLVTHFKSMIIVYAVFLIAVLVLGLAAFAFTTSSSFGQTSSYFTVVGIVAIGVGAFSIYYKQDVQTICYASIVAILFGFFLVYITQTIASKYNNGYDDNDYYIAAVSVFATIVQSVVQFIPNMFC